MIFIVNDEHNYTILQAFSKQKDNIHVVYEGHLMPAMSEDTCIYINVKPPSEDDICFVDSWGLTEDIPQAHIVPKNDDAQKLRIICDILRL